MTNQALIADAAVAAVIVVFAAVGAKKGLFKSLMDLIAVVLALIGAALLASWLARPVTDLVFPLVREKIILGLDLDRAGTLAGALPAAQGTLELGGLELPQMSAERFRALLDTLGASLGRFGFSPEELEHVFSGLTHSAATAAEQAARLIVGAVVQGVLFLLAFLVLRLLLQLLIRALNIAFKLPVLRTANGLGGAAFGVIEGALIVYLVLFLASRFGIDFFREQAAGTRLLNWFLHSSPRSLFQTLLH